MDLTLDAPTFVATEVGPIPSDWDVRSLEKLVLAGPTNGYSGRCCEDTAGTPTLSLSATTSGRLVLNDNTIKYLEQKIPSGSDLFLKTNDVLVQRSNTPDLVGTTAIFNGPVATFVYPDLMMRLRFRDSVMANWFWRFASTSIARRFFLRVAAGSTGSMPKLSGDSLRKMPVPVPPQAEQKAIAEALSDADALIESLEQLIAKKRQIKQGAMQELLTGKRRLPGFEGEWDEVTLGEVGECIIGLTYSPSNVVEHGTLVLRSSNIQNDQLAFEDNVYVDMDVPEKIIVREGDILICVRNGSRALIGKCVRLGPEVAGQTFGAFMSIYRSEHSRFIGHLFRSDTIQQQINQNLGATINQITNKTLNSFEVSLPDEKEQEAISLVLDDFQAELEALESKLSKYCQIKQGMMHNLLTGRIRLV